MASSSAPVHPARLPCVFLVLLVGAYLLVFLTGDKKAEPKLGIDLQGGTRVTLTARTPDGSRPTRDALNQAQSIISDRVNGLGVSGSEVIIDGDNLVITVPGNDSSEARNLGQTARLYIRPVIHAMPAAGQGQPPSEGPQGAPPGAPPAAPPGAPGMPGIPGTPPPGGAGQPPAPPAQSPAPQPRPYPEPPVQPAPSPAPTPASPKPAPSPGQQPAPAPSPGQQPAPAPSPGQQPPPPPERLRSRSASPTRRNCGRAPISRSRSSRCSSRPPVAVRKTCWPETTTRICR